ncbi:aBC transporter ATP-binding protein [Clostridium sp. CAG:628]|nr:aBC transporter ATP-binding protein [Clostridium sp. CAG:628]
MYSVEVKNVSKSLGKNIILEKVNFNLEKGKIYGLVGANGSGKSTLLKIILGLYKSKGKVYINGYDVKKNFKEAISKVSGVVDYVSLYEFLNAKENLRYFAYLYEVPVKRVDEVLDIVKLDGNDRKLVRYYSLGMKQKLGIAISLLKDPDILILDEPTNGLDPKSISELRSTLKSFKDKTIIISSHLISEIEKLSSDILFINKKTVSRITNDKVKREFKLGNYELAKDILPDSNYLTDEEVSVYVKKLADNNIPIYAVNESSSLEDKLISMMGENNEEFNKG